MARNLKANKKSKMISALEALIMMTSDLEASAEVSAVDLEASEVASEVARCKETSLEEELLDLAVVSSHHSQVCPQVALDPHL